MITFRYHLVTIVAVFLALALGILLGTAVVNQGVLDDLERRTNAAVTRADELRDEVDDLSAQVGAWEAFGAAVQPLLIEGKLTGRRVVLVTLDGVEVTEVDEVRRMLELAGASVTGVVVVTAKMALISEAARQEVAVILQSSASRSPQELAEQAAGRLGARLALGPGSLDRDVMELLIGERFLALRGGEDGVGGVGGPGQAVVLLSGGQSEPALPPEAFLSPLAETLVAFPRPVIAAETSQSVYPFVTLVRGDGAFGTSMATVDNADTMPGQVAVVLALRDLYLTPVTGGGDYGIKDGATSLLPRP